MAGGGVLGGSDNGAGVVATWNGLRWSRVKIVDPYAHSGSKNFISSMSCTGPTFCVAADGNGRTLQWNGTKWVFPAQLNAPMIHESINVSCASAKFCLAIGNSGSRVDIWNGLGWTPGPPSDFSHDTNNFVSCTSPQYCVVANGLDQVSDWDGSSWSPVQTISLPSSTKFFDAVSCASGGYCEAVGGANSFLYLYDPSQPPKLPVFCGKLGCIRSTV
jgi:hypothetical protein